MSIKFHEKNQALYVGLQTDSGLGLAAAIDNGDVTLAAVAVTGTAGQCSATSAASLYIGAEVVTTGTLSGTATGIATNKSYYVIATDFVTTFTLSLTRGGSAIVTTAGTTVGLAFKAKLLGPTSAIAVTSITSDPTRETGSFAFLGDALSRDEYTYEKDKYIDASAETFQQVLSDLLAPIDPNTASIWKVLQACGANISVDGTTKFVSAGNNIDSPDYATADLRLSSPDDLVYDKLYKFTDLRGTVDVDASVGEPPKLKLSLKGNATDPVKAVKQAANLGFQTTRVAPTVLPTTIRNAQMVLLDDVFTNPVGTVSSGAYTADGKVVLTFSAPHGLTIGSALAVQTTGATAPLSVNGTFIALVESATKVSFFVKNLTSSDSTSGTIVCKKGDTAPFAFCFSTLSAPNFFGFDLTRYQTGCETGFAKGGVPTDVTIGMLEDQVGSLTGFSPDVYVSKFFGIFLQFSNATSTAGTKVGYLWDKVQIANVKQGKVGSYLGRDVSGRNTGQSFMLWS